MSVKLEVLFLETLKKPNIFHHRGKAQNLNFNSYIYISYYQVIISSYLIFKFPFNFLIFGIKIHLKDALEQPGGGFPAFNAMEVRDRRHTKRDVTYTYVNKEYNRWTIAYPRPNARPVSRDSSNVFHREMKCNKNESLIVDDYI